jgi:hypothetical protein
MSIKKFLIPTLLLIALIPLSVALAQDGLTIDVDFDHTCGEANFSVDVTGGVGLYDVEIDYGDGEEPEIFTGIELPDDFQHVYPSQGSYELSIKITDSDGLEGEYEELIMVDGPEVTLGSSPMPPLVTLENGEALVEFTATVDGGTDPITYEWDLDGDGTPEEVAPDSDSASFGYTEKGTYEAKVSITDGCAFTDTDTLAVVVLAKDTDDESESDQACHPMAQKIADALIMLLPGQTAQEYTCEDIFYFFKGGLTGAQLGFGRMYHAYKMADIIEELTWEDILDWHLDGTGWGTLNQLNKIAGALDEVSITDLIERVLSGENSIQDIRTAARAVTRYDADFEDALLRLGDGASNGELTQFYRLLKDLDLDPETLDEYLASGASLAEIRHAASLADGVEEDLETILTAHSSGNSWGEIKQAYKLANGVDDPATILEMGVQEYRRQLREAGQQARRSERDQRMGTRLAEQFGVPESAVWEAYEACEMNWGCTKKQLRDGFSGEGVSSGENRTAEHIASQYGVSEDEVLQQYAQCNQDWKCVRQFYRDASNDGKGKGKGNN